MGGREVRECPQACATVKTRPRRGRSDRGRSLSRWRLTIAATDGATGASALRANLVDLRRREAWRHTAGDQRSGCTRLRTSSPQSVVYLTLGGDDNVWYDVLIMDKTGRALVSLTPAHRCATPRSGSAAHPCGRCTRPTPPCPWGEGHRVLAHPEWLLIHALTGTRLSQRLSPQWQRVDQDAVECQHAGGGHAVANGRSRLGDWAVNSSAPFGVITMSSSSRIPNSPSM